MWIFKIITDRYIKKIFDAYQKQADEKLYTGKEAELLMQRNEFARCLVETIKKIEVKTPDEYNNYFKLVLKEIDSALKEVTVLVLEHNNQFNTEFTTDLYQTFFTSSLLEFINRLNDLFQKSPSILTNVMDESLFCNNRNVPWFYQFSFVLYDYILEKEFDLLINKCERDIFDSKKQLVLQHIQSAAELHTRCQNENDTEYKNLMNMLLQSMRSQEHDIQQRRAPDNSSSNMYAYFTQTLYKASEKIMGKGQLGLRIDTLIKEFSERSLTNHSTPQSILGPF